MPNRRSSKRGNITEKQRAALARGRAIRNNNIRKQNGGSPAGSGFPHAAAPAPAPPPAPAPLAPFVWDPDYEANSVRESERRVAEAQRVADEAERQAAARTLVQLRRQNGGGQTASSAGLEGGGYGDEIWGAVRHGAGELYEQDVLWDLAGDLFKKGVGDETPGAMFLGLLGVAGAKIAVEKFREDWLSKYGQPKTRDEIIRAKVAMDQALFDAEIQRLKGTQEAHRAKAAAAAAESGWIHELRAQHAQGKRYGMNTFKGISYLTSARTKYYEGGAPGRKEAGVLLLRGAAAFEEAIEEEAKFNFKMPIVAANRIGALNNAVKAARKSSRAIGLEAERLPGPRPNLVVPEHLHPMPTPAQLNR